MIRPYAPASTDLAAFSSPPFAGAVGVSEPVSGMIEEMSALLNHPWQSFQLILSEFNPDDYNELNQIGQNLPGEDSECAALRDEMRCSLLWPDNLHEPQLDPFDHMDPQMLAFYAESQKT